MRRLLPAALLALAALPALAEVPTEVSTLEGSQIVFHVHPFLDETELATLRLVAMNAQALALFVPSTKGYAAIALSPDEGFMDGAQPVASAAAVADLPDAETAAARALEMCNAARKGATECVVVMEIGPAN